MRYAILAPSVHNTQPWRFKITENNLEIFIDGQHILTHGDPTLRELWISLGALMQNLYVAAEVHGVEFERENFDFSGNFKQPVASFKLSLSNFKQPAKDPRLQAITERHSNRYPFENTPVPSSVTESIEGSWQDKDLQTIVSVDQKIMDHVAELVEKGMVMALGNPDFRSELSKLVHTNWTRKYRGMPGYVLGRSAVGSLLEKLMLKTGLGAKKKASEEKKVVKSSGALIFIVTKGDVPSYWLKAGRAYEAAVLEATKNNLAHSTTAAPVEAADFHEEIEQFLGTTWRLQAVVRIGYPVKEPERNSSRAPLHDLLIT